SLVLYSSFLFFQAEDGIRDFHVTGVQTCALPIAPWLNRIPGRLLHTNVIGCAIFAAVSGSSAATVATIGKMTIPELGRRGYPQDKILGTLAGAGTLGLMVPPSIIMIVYGVAADVSISKLFIAGILPGLMLAVLFMGYIAVWAVMHP